MTADAAFGFPVSEMQSICCAKFMTFLCVVVGNETCTGIVFFFILLLYIRFFGVNCYLFGILFGNVLKRIDF